MSEWIELKIDKLPADYLQFEYEFQLRQGCELWGHIFTPDRKEKLCMLEELEDCLVFRYRKPEPKAPTHEEIMTEWWNISGLWMKVICYEQGKYVIGDRSHYLFGQEKSFQWHRKDWFTGRESAEVPPE